MSTVTIRLKYIAALDAANYLRKLWGVDTDPNVMIVGSIRRKARDCGDIELTAPCQPAASDTLFDSIASSLQAQETLWGGQVATQGKAVRGFVPGFTACSLVMEIAGSRIGLDVPVVPIPVQIYRWKAENRGWIELMRTGPREFNQFFLSKWKAFHLIPEGGDGSRDGYLRDRNGNAVITATEAEAFRKLNGMRCVPPEEREAIAVRTAKAGRPEWRPG